MHTRCTNCRETTPTKDWSCDAYGSKYSKGELVCPKCYKRFLKNLTKEVHKKVDK